jgi:hypothetical protein
LTPSTGRQRNVGQIAARYTASNTMNNISEVNVTLFKQEMTQRGLPTDGLKPALVERLEQAMQQPSKQKSNTTSNEDYHTLAARAAVTLR